MGRIAATLRAEKDEGDLALLRADALGQENCPQSHQLSPDHYEPPLDRPSRCSALACRLPHAHCLQSSAGLLPQPFREAS